ncbi:DnaA ATPase domain-containing protein [Litoreibacter roseus]|uniref:Uncharacterized protein n=1 Tax=Litoreibacter roseus TaxID=2601869 RepID=A0A6N6JH87_9RHOB|nr:DnaA/Hda family protein [Litoreibacter roseus]GFE65691.1 hypothetical protein KIN_27650 [Litoreibacter roseus]
MDRQIPFALPVKTAFGRDNYFISDANALAVATVENWSDWPQGKLMLTGDEGAGKSHLAQVWAAEVDGQIMDARAIADADIPTLLSGPLVIEDLHLAAGDTAAETQLFHLYNLSGAEGIPVLFTTRIPAARMDFTVADLKSRMQALQTAQLGPLDDQLLAAILVKLFADHQLRVKPQVLDYTVRRIERSYAAALEFVRKVDRRALAGKSKVTIALARQVLDTDPKKTA